jgi:hypothetical protein
MVKDVKEDQFANKKAAEIKQKSDIIKIMLSVLENSESKLQPFQEKARKYKKDLESR